MLKSKHKKLLLNSSNNENDEFPLAPPPQSPTDNMLSPCTKLLFGPKKLLNNTIKINKSSILNLSLNEQLDKNVYLNPCDTIKNDIALVLGSSSKNRQSVLDTLNWKYQQISAEINEKAIRCKDPLELPVLIAKAKATEILNKINNDSELLKAPALIITCGQIVLYKNEIREKPINSEQAIQYLESYNNDIATTISAVVVTHYPSMIQQSSIDAATIYWNEISSNVITNIVEKRNTTIYSSAGGICMDNDDLKNVIKYIDKPIDSVLGLPMNITIYLMKIVLEEVENQ